jgi:hypothetical protein
MQNLKVYLQPLIIRIFFGYEFRANRQSSGEHSSQTDKAKTTRSIMPYIIRKVDIVSVEILDIEDYFSLFS